MATPPFPRHGALLRPGDKPLRVFRNKAWHRGESLAVSTADEVVPPSLHVPEYWSWEWAWVCRLECPAPERSGWGACCRFHAIVLGERHLSQHHPELVEAIQFRRPLLKKALSVVTVGLVSTLRCG